LIIVGLAMLIWVRPWAGRLARRRSLPALAGAAAPILLALGLAVGACELVLRSASWRGIAEAPLAVEPRLQPDARLGWTLAPSRLGGAVFGSHRVIYAIDAAGERAPSVASPPNPAAPSILFGGESIMFGFGLDWGDSIPARVQARLDVQPVNLAVVGYATDQAFMRLEAQAPRFKRPRAVVLLFSPSLFGKNLTDDRPHLAPDLSWRPARRPWRLEAVALRAAPYRSDAATDRGVAMTRAVLAAIVRMARDRGATPLIVDPVFGREEPAARDLRRRILDETGTPYVLVRLDPAWRIAGDPHPDARGADAIAAAIAARLAASPGWSNPKPGGGPAQTAALAP
jgi:hypothetical protein